MEFTLVETEVRVKDEPADTSDTNTQGHGLIDLISDWKLHPNVECRVTLEKLQNIPSEIQPSVESQGRWRTLSGLQMDDEHDETNTRNEHVEEFIQDPLRTQIPTLDDEIDIKYEVTRLSTLANLDTYDQESGIENNSSSNPDGDHDQDIDPNLLSIFSNMKPPSEPNALYSLLLMCEQDCATCQMYIRQLSEHIRATHVACQLPPEPLFIDPLEVNQSTAIDDSCDVDEDVERSESSDESESDPDYNSESGSESDPDYVNSSVLSSKESGNVRSRKQTMTGHTYSQTGKNKSKMRFNCRNCGKAYSSKSHLRTHTGRRLFKCPKCEKSFSQKVILDYHMRSHTEEKRFNCDLCLKLLGSLSSTMSTLTAALPASPTSTSANSVTPSTCSRRTFPCSHCSKTFNKRSNAVRHEKCHDKLSEKLKCTLCPKLFAQQAYLDAHMSRKHGMSKKAHC